MLCRAWGKAKFIAVNESWRLCPWTSAIYGCDGAWWRKNDGVKSFGGLKVTQEAEASRQFDLALVKLVRGFDAFRSDGVSIGDGGNGGFQALNLAINWGAKRILLVGYDMSLANGEHWHGRHPQGLNNPKEHNIRRWLSARWSTPEGVEIINCNPNSALNAYPKMTFEGAIR